MGYFAGAVSAGIIADVAGLATAILAIGFLTFVSGSLVAWRMPETLRAT